MDEDKKKYSLFGKIDSREYALKIVKDSSIGFFIVAVIQGGVGYFVDPYSIIDGILYAILAAVLWKWHSRISAILLLLLNTGVAILTVLYMFGVTDEGGTNIFLSITILWIAVRSVEATFKLHGKYAPT